jgi:site-specific recombinase XerD
MPVVRLSTTYVTNNLQCPAGKTRIEYCDTECPGLYVEVRSNSKGQGTYYLRYKDGAGKTCHQRIARTADMPLADARAKAKALKAEITLGADPRGTERARKEVLTLDEFFTQKYLPHIKVHKRSWKRDEELYRLRIKKEFGNLRLNQITRQHVQEFHARLVSDGLSEASADHHLKFCKRALTVAVEWMILDVNPLVGLRLFNPDNRVEHYLEDTQLENLLTVLKTDKNRSVCQIAMFLLSTGARLNEAMRATWKQIDRQNRVWRIPASNSKSKRIRSVPLNDSAIEVLNQLATEGTSEQLFINHKTGKQYVNIHKIWDRIRRKAGCTQTRLHDLRHQYASFLVNSGRTLYEVQQILGHSDPKITMRYSHLSSKSLQEAANSASIIIKKGMVPAAA